MKKLLFLTLALLLSVWALIRAAEGTTVQVLPTVSGSSLPAETVLVDNNDIKATTVWTATCGSNNADFSLADPSLSVLKSWLQLRVTSHPNAENPNGTEYSNSTPIVFYPKTDMTLSVYVRTGNNKTLVMTDKTDFSKIAAIDNKNVAESEGSSNDLFFWTYELTANHEYVLSESGGTGRFYGFQYTVSVSDEEPEDPWVPSYPHTWDFTKWSEGTVANLIDGDNWSDDEKGDNKTNITNNNCLWQVSSTTDISPNKYVKANGVTIEELKGLVYNTKASNRSLAIAVNYPSTSLGTYHGPSYLWLGAADTDYFTIPSVPAGATIKMGVESHKTSEARGVQLKVGSEILKAPDGTDVELPTTYDEKVWFVPTTAGEFSDVTIHNTKGSHIYFITVTPSEREMANISWSVESTTLKIRDTFTAPVLKNDDNLPVTFSSSKEEVAVVDENGDITLAGGLGKAVISATYDGEAAGAKYMTTTVNTTIEVVTNVKDAYVWDEYENVESIPLSKLYTADKTSGSLAAGNLIDDDIINIKTVATAKYTSSRSDFLGNTFPGAVQLGRVSAAPTEDNLNGTIQSDNSPIIVTPKVDCKVVMFIRRQGLEQSYSDEDDVENNVITRTHHIGMAPNDGKSVYAAPHSAIDTKLEQNLVFGAYNNATATGNDYMFCAIEWDMKAGETYTLYALSTTINMQGIGYYVERTEVPNDNFGKADLAGPSVYPVNKATMLPLDGSIKLTFATDVNVETAEEFKATLNDKNVTLSANGKEVVVSYSGLTPLTEYTLTIPAGAIGNEDAQIMEDLVHTFTTRQADVLFFSDFNIYPEEYFNKYGNLSANNEFIKNGSTDVTVEIAGMTFYSGTKGRMLAMPGLFNTDSTKDYGPNDANEDAGATTQAVQIIGGTGQYVEFPEMDGPVEVTFWLGNPETTAGTIVLTDEDGDTSNPLASFALPAAKKIKKFTYSYPYSGKVKFRLYNMGKKVDINDALFVKGEGEGIEKPVQNWPAGWMHIPGELDIAHSSWKYDGLRLENNDTNVGYAKNRTSATGEVYVTEAGVYSMNIDFYNFKNAGSFQIEITDQESGNKEVDIYHQISGNNEAEILLEGELSEGKKTIKYTFHTEADGYIVNYRNQTFTKVGETYAALKGITAEGVDAAETEGYDYTFNIPMNYAGETVTLKAELLNATLSVKAGEDAIEVSEEGVFQLPVPAPNEESEAVLTLGLEEGAYAGQTEFKLRLFHVDGVMLTGLTIDGLEVAEETVAALQEEKKDVKIDGYIFTTLPTVKATFKDGNVIEATGTLADNQETATYTFTGVAGDKTEDYSFTLSGFHMYQAAENDLTDVLKYNADYKDKGGEGIWSDGKYSITANDGWDGSQFKMKASNPITLTAPSYMRIKQIKMASLYDNYVPGKVASVTSEGATVYLPSASEFVAKVSDQPIDLVINVENHVEGTPFVITFEGGSQPVAWFEFIYEPIIIDVTDIALDVTEKTITLGEELVLTATVTPGNATDKTVTWTSDNKDVATVANGVVTAVSVGKANITATAGESSATCEVTVYPQLGDADWQNGITTNDAIYIANYVVGKNTVKDEMKEFFMAGADVNKDNSISISDASATVELALKNNSEPAAKAMAVAALNEPADNLVIGALNASANGGSTVAVTLDNSMDYVALQADVYVPEGVSFEVKPGSRIADSHSFQYYRFDDSHVRVAVYTFSGNAFADNDEPLFEIVADSSLADPADISLVRILASDADANEYVLGSRVAGTTGVAALGFDSDAPVKVFDLNGVYVSDTMEGLQQGFYIVRQGNNAKKVRIR